MMISKTDDNTMETDEIDKEELEKQAALIRKLHNLPEPEKVEENAPVKGEKEDGITKTPKDPIPEAILKLDLPKICVVQNLSRKATDMQAKTLMGFIGEIEAAEFFPARGVPCAARCVFIKYWNPYDSGVATHLTNTVFIDKPLTVTVYETSKTEMPSLEEGLKFITPLEAESKHGTLKNEVGGHGIVPGQNLSGRTDRGEGYRGDHTIMNTNYLYQQVEDTPAIDRSVHVQNLDSILVSEVSLVQFLNIAGEVHKVRITGSEAHVEFLKSKSVENALKLDEATFLGKVLRIKPATDLENLEKRAKKDEEDDTMRRVLMAQQLIEDVVQHDTDSEEERRRVKRERVKREVKRERGERERRRSRERDSRGSSDRRDKDRGSSGRDRDSDRRRRRERSGSRDKKHRRR